MKRKYCMQVIKTLVFSVIVTFFASGCVNNATNPLEPFTLLNSSQSSENNQENTNKDNVNNNQFFSINGSVCIEGAIPQELQMNNSENQAVYKTALPSNPAEIIYKITAEQNGVALLSVAYAKKSENGAFNLSVPAGDTKIIVDGYIGSTQSDCVSGNEILHGEKTVTEAQITNKTSVSVNVNVIGSGNGTIDLVINVEDTNKVGSFLAEFYINGSQELIDGNFNLTSTNFYSADVPCGVYDVLFQFYSGADMSGNIVYQCIEKVNVFSNMTTNTWQGGGSAHISTGTFNVTNACLDLYARHDFYVSNAGVNSNTGTYFDPCTFSKAMSLITAYNDGSSEYTIHLLESMEASDSDFGNADIDFLDITYPASASKPLKLKICSYNNPATPYKINANRTSVSTYKGRALKITGNDTTDKNITVTLSNVEITGGYITGTDKGGGIFVGGNATLILDGNTRVVGNHAAALAGGIYNQLSNVVCKNCFVYTNTNGSTDTPDDYDSTTTSTQGSTKFINDGEGALVCLGHTFNDFKNGNTQPFIIQGKIYQVYTDTEIWPIAIIENDDTGTKILDSDSRVTCNRFSCKSYKKYMQYNGYVGEILSAYGHKILAGDCELPDEYPNWGIYEIKTKEQLLRLSEWSSSGKEINYNFIQNADIDMTGVTWIPIGTETNPFSGSYNGNGYKIENITLPDQENTGVFGVMKRNVIENLIVTGSCSNTNDNAGGIVGKVLQGGRINNCVNQINITGKNNVGGIAGKYEVAQAGTVDSFVLINCVNEASVTASEKNAGGLLGYFGGDADADDSKSKIFFVENSGNYGEIKSNSTTESVGGLVGCINDGKIYIFNCMNNYGVYPQGGDAFGACVSTSVQPYVEFFYLFGQNIVGDTAWNNNKTNIDLYKKLSGAGYTSQSEYMYHLQLNSSGGFMYSDRNKVITRNKDTTLEALNDFVTEKVFDLDCVLFNWEAITQGGYTYPRIK